MAVQKITYGNKTDLNTTSVPDANKIKANDINEIKNVVNNNADLIYPVGSIYMSVNNTNPGTLFGGTWEQIKDRFLLSAGSTYTAGNTGGSATHTHTLTNGYAQATYNWISNENRLVLNHKTVGAYIANRYTTTAAPSYIDQNLGGITDAISLGGNTDSSSNMPPYLVVYMWVRTA